MSSVKNRHVFEFARMVSSIHPFTLPERVHGEEFTVGDALDLINGAQRHRTVDLAARPAEPVVLAQPSSGVTVRLLAGKLGEHVGPTLGGRLTAIVHATVTPGEQLRLPWSVALRARAFVLAGRAIIGTERSEVQVGEFVVLERKIGVTEDVIAIDACDSCHQNLEVLLAGEWAP